MFHNHSVKGTEYICALKAKGRHTNRAAPNDSNHDGSIAHATGRSQGCKESRKCSYYNLYCHFNKLFLIHGIRF